MSNLVMFKLELDGYSESELSQMWRDGIISKEELSEELSSRERIATYSDRQAM